MPARNLDPILTHARGEPPYGVLPTARLFPVLPRTHRGTRRLRSEDSRLPSYFDTTTGSTVIPNIEFSNYRWSSQSAHEGDREHCSEENGRRLAVGGLMRRESSFAFRRRLSEADPRKLAHFLAHYWVAYLFVGYACKSRWQAVAEVWRVRATSFNRKSVVC